jgi:hypothetical protein
MNDKVKEVLDKNLGPYASAEKIIGALYLAGFEIVRRKDAEK